MPTRPTRCLPLLATFLAAAATATATAAGAQDWPQWRGPERDGFAADFEAPASWPEEMELVWRTEVGAGYSSPVAAAGRICVHSRMSGEEVVTCLDAKDGTRLWQASYPAPYEKNSYALKHGEGPNSTPVIHDGKLFTLGMSGILSSFELASGELVWRADRSAGVSTKNLFCGTSASPIVDRGLVLAHLGDDSEGVLTAFDAATGETRWSWSGAGPGYASPVVVEVAGVRQLVTLTSGSIIGVAVADGRLLWQVDFQDKWNENIVTPVFHGDVLIASGVRQGTVARRILSEKQGWQAAELWTRADLPQYMSSPLVEGDVLYGFSSLKKGQLFALDLRTGEGLWSSEGRLGHNAALVAAGDGQLAALTTEGELIFVRRSPEAFRELARYQVADTATWAHPILFADRVVIKDAQAVSLWRIATPLPVAPLPATPRPAAPRPATPE